MATLQNMLKSLYSICAMLSVTFFIAIFAIIIYDLCGPVIGYIPKSTDELAGYCMAASAFLGLGYTFTNNDHIRVELFVRTASASTQHSMNFVSLMIACFIVGFLAWFSVRLAWDSWFFEDVSQGLVALPLWIPQSAMAVGSIVFFIAILERTLGQVFASIQKNESLNSNV